MNADMEKRPRNPQPLMAAREILRSVIVEQRAATEELHASNRELGQLLDEVLASRSDLRYLADAEVKATEPLQPPRRRSANTRPDAIELELEEILERAGQAIHESAHLRQRSRKIREALARSTGRVSSETPAALLSKREHQVLDLIVQGKTSKEIAAALGISFKTAVTHRSSIMSKLDVHQIASVVREAIRRGLV